ncbi:DUF397 domain-containing protein [Nocardiopsis dassonvillei]
MTRSDPQVTPDADELATANWFKSRMSSATQGCVEVAHLSNGTVLRDSKDPDGGYLFFTPHEWDCFLDGANKGEFKR